MELITRAEPESVRRVERRHTGRNDIAMINYSRRQFIHASAASLLFSKAALRAVVSSSATVREAGKQIHVQGEKYNWVLVAAGMGPLWRGQRGPGRQGWMAADQGTTGGGWSQSLVLR